MVFFLSNSDTSRSRKPHEQDGRDYHFVPREEMERGIINHRYVNHVNTFISTFSFPSFLKVHLFCTKRRNGKRLINNRYVYCCIILP